MANMTSKYKKFSVSDLLKSWPELLKANPSLSDSEMTKEISQVSSMQDPQAGSIVFASDADANILSEDRSQSPAVMVLPLNAPAELLTSLAAKNISTLLSPNPKLAMALVSQNYFLDSRIDNSFSFARSEIHPTAVIHESAKIGVDVKIGPNVVIGQNCLIADRCKIGANVVIENDVVLGESCHIYPNVVIGWASELGAHCWVQSNSCIGSDGFGYATDQRGQHFAIPHVGRVLLGQHVHIGAGTQIDRGTFGETSIGDFTKIDNLVHIAHNCKIGKSCMITAGFMVAGSTEIGNFFVCGGRTTVNGHIKITDHVQAAGVSTIQASITKPGKYGGYPLMPLSQFLKVSSSFTKLFEFRKDLNRVMKHLKLDKE